MRNKDDGVFFYRRNEGMLKGTVSCDGDELLWYGWIELPKYENL
jgi:hypothetical protein